MKKIFISSIITIGLLSVALINCATGPVQGVIFTGATFPGEINTSNNVNAVKKAEGCTKNVLGLVTWGDSSAGKIALENKISKIATIDHSAFSVLTLVYRDYCTIVTGE